MSSDRTKLAAFTLLGAVSGALLTVYLQQRRSAEDVQKDSQNTSLTTTNSNIPPPPSCIYCDYNATTPVYPEVYQAMIPYLTDHYGNPSSSHVFGQIAKRALDLARKQVSEVINASSESEIYFVSCGTEADNRCVDVALTYYNKHRLPTPTTDPALPPLVITSSIEHPAVLAYLRSLELQKRLELKVVAVNDEGVISLEALEAALGPRAALVTVMHSNNEIGTIQPIRAISKIIRSYNKKHGTSILFHTDAAQSIGKVPVDVQSLGVDMLTIVGHKFGAPKGVAALYVRQSVPMTSLLLGGSQEFGFRGGTESIPAIVALGEAARLAKTTTKENSFKLLALKHRFHARLLGIIRAELQKHSKTEKDFVRFNGPKRSNDVNALQEDLKMLKLLLRDNHSSDVGLEQLPNTVSVSFNHLIGHDIVHALADKVAFSTGSACHALPASHSSKVYAPSEVLLAIGVDTSFGVGTIRVSFGRFSTDSEVDTAADVLATTIITMWREKNLL